MIDDRKPNFARGFRISTRQLGDLQSTWREAGRKAWEIGTRLGQDIKARTEKELEALGREYLRRGEARQGQADVARQAVKGAVREGVAVVRAAPAAVTEGVRYAANATRSLPDAVRSGVRAATGAYKIAARAAAPSGDTNPSPARLTFEWATGLGPQTRVLGPNSAFTEEFVRAPSVQSAIQRDLADWSRRDGELAGTYIVPHERRANFDAGDFLTDLEAGNGASHFVGSWDVKAARHGDGIDWRVENDADTTSFFAGRKLRDASLPYLPSYQRGALGFASLPGGRTHQTILFRTDLDGRPLP